MSDERGFAPSVTYARTRYPARCPVKVRRPCAGDPAVTEWGWCPGAPCEHSLGRLPRAEVAAALAPAGHDVQAQCYLGEVKPTHYHVFVVRQRPRQDEQTAGAEREGERA